MKMLDINGSVDVCGLEHGHEGPHVGKFKGYEWTREGRERPNIIKGKIVHAPPPPGVPMEGAPLSKEDVA